MIKTIGNILWHFPFLGFIEALFVYVLGLILCVTVVGAPIGLGLMGYGEFLFAPFSYAMVSKSDLNVKQNSVWKVFSTIVMLLYIPFGIVLSLIAIIQVALLFVLLLVFL